MNVPGNIAKFIRRRILYLCKWETANLLRSNWHFQNKNFSDEGDPIFLFISPFQASLTLIGQKYKTAKRITKVSTYVKSAGLQTRSTASKDAVRSLVRNLPGSEPLAVLFSPLDPVADKEDEGAQWL